MAKPKSLDAKINALTRLVEKSAAAVANDIAHRPTNSSVAHIVESAIRSVVPGIVRDETKDMRAEIVAIGRQLEELKLQADNSAGLTKEIDHALERIAAIEKHLGISKKIAA
jgi:hypothetical protein